MSHSVNRDTVDGLQSMPSIQENIELDQLRYRSSGSSVALGFPQPILRSRIQTGPIIAQPVPSSHRKLQLQLHTAGAYAVQAGEEARLPEDFDRGYYGETQHRLFGRLEQHLVWKPWLSGPSGRCIQLVIIFVTVVCHFLIVSHASSGRYTILSRIGPAVLAIVSVKSMLFITSQELRRMANTPPEELSAPHHYRSITRQKFLMLVVFAPLISVHVRPMVSYASTWDYRTPWPHCFNFDALADYVGGQFPQVRYKPDHYHFLTRPGDDFGQWPLSDDPKSSLTSHVNRSRALCEPFTPMNVLPKNLVSARWDTHEQSVLKVSVVCQNLEVLAALPDTENDLTFNVEVFDSDGCGAHLTMTGESVSNAKRADFLRFAHEYGTFLSSLTTAFDVDDPYFESMIESFRPRLAQYVADLENSESIKSIVPQWVPASLRGMAGDQSMCQGRFFLGISPDPFVVIGNDSSTFGIQTASCTTAFELYHPSKTTHENDFWDVPFIEQNPGLSKSHVPDVGLSCSYDTRELRPAYHTHEMKIAANTNRILNQRVSSMKIFDEWHPLQLIEYGFWAQLGSLTGEQDIHYPIAYGSDQFVSRITQDLSIAVKTFSPTCQKVTDRIHMSPRYTYYEEKILQKQLWFQIILWFSIYGLVFSTIASHIDADDSSSGLPWEISSIAARAVLLCHSRLPRCFATDGHIPKSLIALYPVRIGRWSHSEDVRPYSWRVDSLLNECEIKPLGASQPTWHRYSVWSVPILARPNFVFRISVLLIAIMATGYWSAQKRVVLESSAAHGVSLAPVMLGTDWGLARNFGQVVRLQIIPALISISLTTYWWDSLTSFYKARLPWVELTRPNVASKTLTLDYLSTPVPLLKAMQNKHWMLSLLIIGSFVVIPLPVLSSLIFELEWTLETSDTVIATKNSTWQQESMNASDPTIMREVLQDSLVAWDNASALPKWSSYREALLPIDLGSDPSINIQGHLAPGHVGYWELETDSIRAELQCTALAHEQILGAETSLWQRRDSSRRLRAHLDSTYLSHNGSEYLIVSPCFNQNIDKSDPPEISCSHWDLVNLKLKGLHTTALAWAISAAHWNESSESSQVLLCQPRIFSGKGKTRIVSTSGNFTDGFVHTHSSTGQELLGEGLAWDYSTTLNHSVFEPDGEGHSWDPFATRSGLRFNSSLVSAPGFRGDLLSLMIHKYATRNGVNLGDSGTLANLSSLVFSTIFSIAAQRTDLLKMPTATEHVSIKTLSWRETFVYDVIIVRLTVAIVLFVLCVMAAHIAVLHLRKEYFFPIAPEPLENTWFFLYRSSIVRIMEEKIKNPQNLTLQEFYAQVRGLGYKYVFGRQAGELNWANARVDVADDFDILDTMIRHRSVQVDEEPSMYERAEVEQPLLAPEDETRTGFFDLASVEEADEGGF